MKITFNPTTGRFLATASFHEKDILKASGFFWDPGKRLWWTNNKTSASKLRAHFDAAAREEVKEAEIKAEETYSVSAAEKPLDGFTAPSPAGMEFFPYQHAGIQFALGRKNTLIGDEMGVGKEQWVGSPVLTPTGERRIGDLRVGDEIIGGSTGKTQLITGVFPQGVKQLYRVTFNDGSSTLCGSDHLWDVRTDNCKRRGKGWRTMDIKSILAAGSLKTPSGGHRWEIPLAPVIEFPKTEQPVPPYLLGTLLGNGGLTGTSSRISTRHPQQLELIAEYMPEGVFIDGPPPSDPNIYFLTTRKNGKGHTNPLTHALRKIGVHGKRDFEKEIPQEYLIATAADRLALLQGLMDTDGGTFEARNRFTSSSEQLALQVVWLVRSLGGWANRHISPAQDRGNYDMHVVVIMLPGLELFRLDYHKDRQTEGKSRPRRCIVAIEKEFVDEAVCIRVDDPKSLYLTDDLIVTHNTCQAIGVLNCMEEAERCLVICPASLKLNWMKELKSWLVRDAQVTALYSNKKHRTWGNPEAKLQIYVINYDVVEKFDLKSAEWDLLIIDEVHYLKNSSSKRRREIWGGREQKPNKPVRTWKAIPAKRTLALTGTPVCNRPSELWTMLRALDPETWTSGMWQPFHVKYCAAVKGKFGWVTSGASNLAELNKILRSTIMIRRMKADVLLDLPPKTRKTTLMEANKDLRLLLSKEAALQHIHEVGIKNAEQAEIDLVRDWLEVDGEEGKSPTVVGTLAKIRRMVGEIKAPDAAAYAKQLLEDGLECLVVFAHHKDVVAKLEEELKEYGVVKIVGGMTSDEKQRAIDDFQEGRARVFIGSITAAGVGITLTRATHTLFVEVDWVPGNLQQAEDRTHRHGQRGNVVIEYLIYEGSIDTVMVDAVASKKDVIDEITK